MPPMGEGESSRSTPGRSIPSSSVSQACAVGPATKESSMGRARLGRAVLRRMKLADSPGGVPKKREVIQSVRSGLMWIFVRELKPAIYGAVWDALEIQLEGGGRYFSVRRDERGRERRVAVKRMPWRRIARRRGRESSLREIAVLGKLGDPGHPHVLKMVEALDDGSTVYLVTPFISDELFEWVRERGASHRDVVQPLSRQIIGATRYMHSKGICHIDMSLENALIDAEGENVYIIDFGMSVAMPFDQDGRRLLLVPDGRSAKPSYCAPEMIQQEAYDGVKADVFAVGCMIFMMLAGFPAFTAPLITDPAFELAVRRGDVGGLLEKYGRPPLGPEVTDLLKKMMAFRPDDRPTPEEALKHPWLALPATDTREIDADATVPGTAAAGAVVGGAVEAEGQSQEGSSPGQIMLDRKPPAAPSGAAPSASPPGTVAAAKGAPEAAGTGTQPASARGSPSIHSGGDLPEEK